MSTNHPGASTPIEAMLGEMAWARRLARRLALGDADADEAVQDAWVASLRHPPAPDRPVRPWLAQVLRRQLWNRWRGERRRQRREQEAPGEPVSASPDELHEQLEAHRQLVGLVDALEEPYRQVVWLRYFESLSSAQIAARLGIAAATVRGRLRTALEKLRASLDTSHGDRRRWVRLFVPLAAGPATGGPPAPLTGHGGSRRFLWPALGGALGLVLLTALVALFFGVRGVANTRSPRTDPIPAEAAAPPAARPPGPGGGQIPGEAASLPACQERLTGLRRQEAEVERGIWTHGTAQTLFTLGAANPEPPDKLIPILTRIVRADRAETPPLGLECRTWACELRVLEASADGLRLWLSSIQSDQEFVSHRRNMGFVDRGRPVRDPVSGNELIEHRVVFGLRDPSGRPVEAPQAPAPTPSATDLPVVAGECWAQVGALETRLVERQAVLARDLPIRERYRQGSRNPPLEQRMWAIVGQVHGSDIDEIALECRDRVCRVENLNLWAGLFPGWSKPLMRWMRDRKLWTSISRSDRREVYFELAPDPTASTP